MVPVGEIKPVQVCETEQKIRVGKPKSGKSGGYRVFYLDLPELGQTYLMTLLDKRDAENISDEEKTLLRIFAKKIKVR